MRNQDQVKILAAALYEIRCQLGKYLGSKNDANPEVRLSAHLAYALHNEALAIIEGDGAFDVVNARLKILQAEKVVNAQYIDFQHILKSNAAQQGGAPEMANNSESASPPSHPPTL